MCGPEHAAKFRAVMGPNAWVCPLLTVILERDAAKARARAREHLSFYAAQPNYQRILMSQGFAQAESDPFALSLWTLLGVEVRPLLDIRETANVPFPLPSPSPIGSTRQIPRH
jgi:hypothetical protein